MLSSPTRPVCISHEALHERRRTDTFPFSLHRSAAATATLTGTTFPSATFFRQTSLNPNLTFLLLQGSQLVLDHEKGEDEV